MQAGNGEHSMFLLAISTCPFYYVLLEQLYTGEMNFPPIGVDEGSVFYFLICLVTGIIGSQELWLQTKVTMFGLLSEPTCLRDILSVGMKQILVIYVVQALVNIYMKRNNPHFKKMWNLEYFVNQFMFYPISFATYYYYGMVMPGNMWELHNVALQVGNGFQFIYVMLRLQVCMITLEQAMPWRRTIILTWVLMWVNLYVYTSTGETLFEPVHLLHVTSLY